jgi:predicted nucleic acid-binding protein
MDTNIWLYGLTSSQIATEQAKHAAAVALLERVAQHAMMIISTQVVNECHWNLTRKFSYADRDVYEIIERNMLSIANVHSVTLRMYCNAFAHRLSAPGSKVQIKTNCPILLTRTTPYVKLNNSASRKARQARKE